MTGKNGETTNIINSKKVVLIDLYTDLQKHSEIIGKPEFEIITFNYNLHKILNSKNIIHKISDDFLPDDINYIQKLTRKFSYWYKELEVLDLIKYKQVNMGRLFYPELHYFLVPFLKSFFEISKICQEYKNCNLMTSPNLFQITELFSNSVENLSPNTKLSTNYLYDSLKMSIRIANTNHSFRMPQKYFKKFKNYFENFLKPFISKKYKIPSQSSVLLVEFDTIRHRKLFDIAKNMNLNLVNYGHRRPVIWNRESYNIIKNSNCFLINFENIFDKNLKNLIRQGESELEKKLTKLWNKQDFFKNYFSINENSFWDILKPIFVELLTKRFFEAISEIEITKKIFELYNFSNILILSEHGYNEQILIEISKQQNIPITLLQHGVFFDTKEAFDQNVFAGILPMDSDFFVVWGDIVKDYSIESDISPKKIKPLGSIFYDEIFDNKQKNLNLKSEYVLLALAWPGKNQVNDLTIQTLESIEKCVKEICTIISNQKKKLIIKIHPYAEQEDLTDFIKKINPEISVLKNSKILDLIQSCELFITLDLSTTILEAQILEKPVISVIVRDTGLGNPSIFRNNSCIRIPIEQFQTEFEHITSSNDYREKIIDQGNKFVKEYISGSNASSRILSNLEKS